MRAWPLIAGGSGRLQHPPNREHAILLLAQAQPTRNLRKAGRGGSGATLEKLFLRNALRLAVYASDADYRTRGTSGSLCWSPRAVLREDFVFIRLVLVHLRERRWEMHL